MLEDLKNKAVILVTHDVQEAFELGTRVCLLDQGTIQQLGTPEEMLFNPANDFVSRFFDNQRLLLELKALRLEAVKPWLEIPVNMDNGISCWEALEKMTATQTDSSSLMRAFTLYKQTHGRTTKLS